MSETIIGILSMFKKPPTLIIFVCLIVFHLTVITGDYAAAMALIHTPKYSNAIELIRNYSVNLFVFGWSYYCWIFVKPKLLKKNANIKADYVENFLLFVILIRYFIDITKYHNSNPLEFIHMTFCETWWHWLFVFITLIGTTAFIFFKTEFKSGRSD